MSLRPSSSVEKGRLPTKRVVLEGSPRLAVAPSILAGALVVLRGARFLLALGLVVLSTAVPFSAVSMPSAESSSALCSASEVLACGRRK